MKKIPPLTAPELKLMACLEPWRELNWPDSFKTSAISVVARNFERNASRVHSLTCFPANLANSMYHLFLIDKQNTMESINRLADGEMSVADLEAIVQHNVVEYGEQREAVISQGGEGARKLFEDEYRQGFNLVDQFLRSGLRSAAEAWLASIVTGMWTAFEAAAEEIWEAALNAHPKGLAELEGAKSGGGNETKSVSLSQLQQYGYDLSSLMGTILKSRYSFDRIDQIRKAYADAFKKQSDADKILLTLESSALDALSLVRNVLVHNGGIVDKQYFSRSKNIDACPKAEIGQPIVLDGFVAAKLFGPVLLLSAELLKDVDNWLAARGVK